MSFSSTSDSMVADNPSPGQPSQLSVQPEQNEIHSESSQNQTLYDSCGQGELKTGGEATVHQDTQKIMEPLQQQVKAIRQVLQTEMNCASDLQMKLQQEISKLTQTKENTECYSLLVTYSQKVIEAFRTLTEHTEQLQSNLEGVEIQISATGELASLSPEASKMSQNIDEKKLLEVRQKMQPVVSPKCFQRATKLMNKPTQPELLKLCILLVDELHRMHKAENQPSPSSRSWIKPTVKVFSFVAGQTFGAHDAILKLVVKMNLDIQLTNQQESDIIMIFCPITSRSGSDVEAALSRKEVSSSGKPVILVLMHHTRDVEYSVGRKWTENDRNVVLEVHVLFHETLPGLLQCDRNKQAARQIQHMLDKHSKYRWTLW